MFSSSDLEWTQPYTPRPTESAPILRHLWPLAVASSPKSSCRFGKKLLCFASNLLLYDATLTSMSAYTMFNDPATHCDWLKDTQCFIRPETSHPYKNKKIKAEDGVSVYTTTTTHTWWLCKTTLFQSKFCFWSWNCTLYLQRWFRTKLLRTAAPPRGERWK